MKTILGLLFVLISITAFGQVDKKPFTEVDEEEPINSNPFKIHPKGIKLFGDIYFGMSKQEVRELTKPHNEKQSITVIGYKIKASPYYSQFNENGLCVLGMTSYLYPNPHMSNGLCKLALNATDSIMTNLGAKCIYKNENWPDPLLMPSNIASIYNLNGNSIKLTAHYTGGDYSVDLLITTIPFENANIKKSKSEFNKSIEEAKTKF